MAPPRATSAAFATARRRAARSLSMMTRTSLLHQQRASVLQVSFPTGASRHGDARIDLARLPLDVGELGAALRDATLEGVRRRR